ncbi:MAG: hypothetical protein WCD89_21810 [Anaerocolumna sp.]
MGFINSISKIFELIYDEGLKEWLDETKYMEALNELYTKVENEEITEEQYEEAEAEILEQLKAVRNFKKEQGYDE